MGSVKRVKKRVDKSKMEDVLTDKQLRFVDEYVLDFNATHAAVRAGYSKVSASVTGCNLLKNKLVKDAIGRVLNEVHNDYKRQLISVIRQIAVAANRDAADMIDPKTGLLLPLNKLPPAIRMSVNGIKQKERKWIDEEGNEHNEVETEITLVPKQVAWDMANKILGNYAPERAEVKLGIDWDSMQTKQTNPPNVLDVDALLIESKPESKNGQ